MPASVSMNNVEVTGTAGRRAVSKGPTVWSLVRGGHPASRPPFQAITHAIFRGPNVEESIFRRMHQRVARLVTNACTLARIGQHAIRNRVCNGYKFSNARAHCLSRTACVSGDCHCAFVFVLVVHGTAF